MNPIDNEQSNRSNRSTAHGQLRNGCPSRDGRCSRWFGVVPVPAAAFILPEPMPRRCRRFRDSWP